MRRGRPALRALLAALCAAAAGCATAPRPTPRDAFPLDPREGLPGPFDSAIARGWRALQSGDWEQARREFARASSRGSARAAAIGGIEALVLDHRSSEAIASCDDLLGQGNPTLPLLVACGEARVRTADPVGAAELYTQAAAMAPDRPGLDQRAEQLREEAAETLLDAAARSAEQGRPDQARLEVTRALATSPRSAALLARAGDVECDAGDREQALEYYRQALSLGGVDPGVEARAGSLAMQVGDFALAVSIFENLASRDPSFAQEAARARFAFRVANWPDAERQAARSRRLTRGGAAALVWWTFPEVREARVTAAGVVATDVLERNDSRVMMRAVALGLLDVDPDTHRVRPDAPLTRAAAARMLVKLAARLAPPGGSPRCFQGAPGPGKPSLDAIRVAGRCGLLSESGASVVSGAEFTRGLDRLRSLFPAGEAMSRD